MREIMKETNNITLKEKFVDIETHKLRVLIADFPSDITIVLEAGGGENSDSYNQIQEKLAKRTQTRVISYDRSGWGKSDLGPDTITARDECIALKKILKLLGIKENLILAGLSYGGYLIQFFTQMFPTLVKGLILIDPMNVDFVDKITLEKLNASTPYFDNPTSNREKAGNRQVDQFEESLKFLRGKKIPTYIPVRLLTAGIPLEPVFWRECHEKLVQDSIKHKLIIADNCEHHIVNCNPELVLDSIYSLLKEIQSNS